MLTDLILTVLHHVTMFALVAVLVMELMLARPDLTPDRLTRLVRIDQAYGGLAVLMLIFGFSRVFFGLKGAEFYLGNHIFWTKIALFVLVGILSVPPTIRFTRWRRALADDPSFNPPLAEIKKARRFMHMQAAVFILIPVMAAMLGRGYGA
jgi:putative membrane protein